MKLVVFGLTVSSSWGDGHAALWRGLIRALERRGHDVVFFERDAPNFAAHRDLTDLDDAELILYADWEDVRVKALGHLLDADAAMVTSDCPDALTAMDLVREHAQLSVFYDLDTPVTLACLAAGQPVVYLPPDGLAEFDLVLSYTGGRALRELEQLLGARHPHALYGHVDPDAHPLAAPDPRFACDLSFIGAYAADRQPGLETLFIEPGRRRPEKKLVLAGSGFPQDYPWTDNIWFEKHLPPTDHPAFYSSSKLTVNVTRHDMRAMGWCPSGRLFEAAACGCPVLSDLWEGLDHFLTPGREILVARDAEEATAALDVAPDELARIAAAARERVLDQHTSDHRAGELLEMLAQAAEGDLNVEFPQARVAAAAMGV